MANLTDRPIRSAGPLTGRAWAAAGLAALVLALGACTTTSEVVSTSVGDTRPEAVAPRPVAQPAPSVAGSGGSSRGDLVTSSDESDLAKRARIRLELASAYFAQGQSGTALDEVKRALQADPNNAAAYGLRGLIYASLAENALADESFRRALALNGSDAGTLNNYGWFLCSQQRYPESRRQFQAALAAPQAREASKTLLAAGVCEARAGDLDAAERLLQRSFETDAANPTTAVNLAEVLLRKGDFDRARFYVQRVNQNAELANAETLWLAARVEHRRKNPAAVEALGQQLRSRFPGSREAAAFERGQLDE
jgi:type IV pilus assembly protein PilF